MLPKEAETRRWPLVAVCKPKPMPKLAKPASLRSEPFLWRGHGCPQSQQYLGCPNSSPCHRRRGCSTLMSFRLIRLPSSTTEGNTILSRSSVPASSDRDSFDRVPIHARKVAESEKSHLSSCSLISRESVALRAKGIAATPESQLLQTHKTKMKPRQVFVHE